MHECFIAVMNGDGIVDELQSVFLMRGALFHMLLCVYTFCFCYER